MKENGILRIDVNTGVSRLDAGPGNKKRLAKQGDGDQFGNATDFLVNERGLNDGDFIWVDGSTAGDVITITNAGPGGVDGANDNLIAESVQKKPASKRTAAKKSSAKSGQKKPAGKKNTAKSGAKKTRRR